MNKDEKVKKICERLLYEHEALAKFIGGFRFEPCQCEFCLIAREILNILKGE